MKGLIEGLKMVLQGPSEGLFSVWSVETDPQEKTPLGLDSLGSMKYTFV